MKRTKLKYYIFFIDDFYSFPHTWAVFFPNTFGSPLEQILQHFFSADGFSWEEQLIAQAGLWAGFIN